MDEQRLIEMAATSEYVLTEALGLHVANLQRELKGGALAIQLSQLHKKIERAVFKYSSDQYREVVEAAASSAVRDEVWQNAAEAVSRQRDAEEAEDFGQEGC